MKKNSTVTGFIAGVVVSVIVCSVFTLVYFKPFSHGGKSDSISEKLALIEKEIDSEFYKKYDKTKVKDMLAKAYVKALGDKYSRYMTEKEYAEYLEDNKGSYSGIGIVYEKAPRNLYRIRSVMKKSPAEEAGLKKGDVITKVEGRNVDKGKDVLKLIKGKAGTKVKLVIKRAGKLKSYTIVRRDIKEKTVYSRIVKKKFVQIRITSFGVNTATEFKKEYRKYKDKGFKNIILDLRYNGGGFLDSALAIGNMFVDKGTAIKVYNKSKEEDAYEYGKGKEDAKVVILVNKYSASASEILAVSLQENGVAKLVGEKTYGKGVIQTTLPLKSGGALYLTTLEYVSPKGKKIHGVGITPDYIVHNKYSDKQLNRAISLLNK